MSKVVNRAMQKKNDKWNCLNSKILAVKYPGIKLRKIEVHIFDVSCNGGILKRLSTQVISKTACRFRISVMVLCGKVVAEGEQVIEL